MNIERETFRECETCSGPKRFQYLFHKKWSFSLSLCHCSYVPTPRGALRIGVVPIWQRPNLLVLREEPLCVERTYVYSYLYKDTPVDRMEKKSTSCVYMCIFSLFCPLNKRLCVRVCVLLPFLLLTFGNSPPPPLSLAKYLLAREVLWASVCSYQRRRRGGETTPFRNSCSTAHSSSSSNAFQFRYF